MKFGWKRMECDPYLKLLSKQRTRSSIQFRELNEFNVLNVAFVWLKTGAWNSNQITETTINPAR